MTENEEFLKRLLEMFRVEADERIRTMSDHLVTLEKNSDPQIRLQYIESVYREAHSLKGAARSVNLIDVESVCQSLEGVFSVMKRSELEVSAPLLATLHEAIDLVQELIAHPEERSSRKVTSLIIQIDKARTGQFTSEGSSLSPITPHSTAVPGSISEARAQTEDTSSKRHSVQSDTIRISTKKLDGLMLQAEELLSLKLALNQRSDELSDLLGRFETWQKEWKKLSFSVQPWKRGKKNGSAADPVGKIEDFLLWNSTYMKSLEGKVSQLRKETRSDGYESGAKVDLLLEEVKKVMLVPFSSFMGVLPKIVRDLSHAQAKSVHLEVEGGEIEVDRRILEKMKDPFIHLLRNCVDHGIETPEVRRGKGKPEEGKISIAIIQREAGRISILLEDDGNGIDPAAVTESAIRKNIISPEDAGSLNPRDALDLIFRSEVSTSPIVTDLSGRGLGLAIVRQNVEELGGTIAVESMKAGGTTFTLTLPVSRAALRGILVRAAGAQFVVPSTQVDRVGRIKREEIKTVQNKETVIIDGKPVSFVWMEDVLNVTGAQKLETSSSYQSFVLLRGRGSQIAFGVDEVHAEQEILVKGLGRHLVRVRNIGGATVLGSGKVVPILHVDDVILSATQSSVSPRHAAASRSEIVSKKKSILVVEDSITSRMLLKNVLESAGYTVVTTVDGLDGLTTLKTGEFDLVVSDVEMPRMNGFELTQSIRANETFSTMPVVLVTALDARADKERGIEVGANAYIVKSSFDQSNLLNVISRLI